MNVWIFIAATQTKTAQLQLNSEREVILGSIPGEMVRATCDRRQLAGRLVQDDHTAGGEGDPQLGGG